MLTYELDNEKPNKEKPINQLDNFKNHFLILKNNKLLTYELHKQTTKINKRLWQTSMSKFLHQIFVIKDFAIKKPSKPNTPKKTLKVHLCEGLLKGT